jgi:cadmium resistance protein CadD (predicted permease)
MSIEQDNDGELIGSAFISFIATNIDDLFVLLNLFIQASMPNSSLKVRDIFIGQYLGFLIILGITLIAVDISSGLPVQMIGFLGFIPLILGIKGIVEIIIERRKKSNDIIDNDNTSTIELEKVSLINDVHKEKFSELTNDQEQQNSNVDSPSKNQFKEKILKLFSCCFNRETLKVVSITFATCADIIAIYTPLFAQATKWEIGIYIVIFLVLICVWILLAYYFINLPPILKIAQQYGKYIVPIVFLILGIYVIVASDCFPWLVRAIRTKNFKYG